MSNFLWLGQPRAFGPRITPREYEPSVLAAWLPPIEERLLWMGFHLAIENDQGGRYAAIITSPDRQSPEAFAVQLIHGPWALIVQRRAAARAQRLHDLYTEDVLDTYLGHRYPLTDEDVWRLWDRRIELTRLEWS